MQTITLEEVDGILVGRIYVDGKKTAAYIIPEKENEELFTEEQLILINNKLF